MYLRWADVGSNADLWAQHSPASASTSLALQLQREVALISFSVISLFLVGTYISHLLEGRDRLSLLPALSL